MSPISAMVRSQQPRVAIVRRLSMARQSHSSLSRLPQPDGAPTRPNTTGGSGSLYNSDRPPLGRSRLPANRFEENIDDFEEESLYLRPLSRRERAEKRVSAVLYFREARDINERSRSVDAIESVLANARQQKDSQARPRKSVTAAQRSSGKKPEQPPCAEVSSGNGSFVMAEEDANIQQKSSGPESSPLPLRKKTLAEQFGYGIAPKPGVALASTAPSQPVQQKSDSFVRVEAGTTDLLERLAAKRQQSSLAAAGA